MQDLNSYKIFGLSGKAVLVTGASRGIGKAIAEQLARAGAIVGLVHSGTSEASKKVVDQMCSDFEALGNGAKGVPLVMNVADESSVEAAMDTFTKAAGGLYGLVNNAGVTADGLLMRHKTSDWDKVIDTNLRGAFLTVRAGSRALMKAGGASIVNLSSVVGEMGNPGQVSYVASKAGLIGMTKAMAKELASRQVRVNAVAPGFIETDMTSVLTPDQKNQMLAQIPLNSLGSVEDIAWATLYLLSPLSKYMTGQVLRVNGGMYM